MAVDEVCTFHPFCHSECNEESIVQSLTDEILHCVQNDKEADFQWQQTKFAPFTRSVILSVTKNLLYKALLMRFFTAVQNDGETDFQWQQTKFAPFTRSVILSVTKNLLYKVLLMRFFTAVQNDGVDAYMC